MSKPHIAGRTLARSQALQLLFQAEASGRTVDEVLSGDYVLSEGPLDPFGEQLARGCAGMVDDLDPVISSVSENWSLKRMPGVDRNLLRLATYELIAVEEVATAVTCNEYVRLARAYGTDESSRFVNGVLGRIARDLDAGIDVVAVAREQVQAQAEAEAQAQTEPEAEAQAQAEPEAEAQAQPEADAPEVATDEVPADSVVSSEEE